MSAGCGDAFRSALHDSVKVQPMDPPAAPGRGFFFDEAEMSQSAVTSPWAARAGLPRLSLCNQAALSAAKPRSVKPASLFSSDAEALCFKG